MRWLLLVVFLFALSSPASAEVIGKKPFSFLGENLTVRLATYGSGYRAQFGSVLQCFSEVQARTAMPTVFTMCDNGWAFTSAEWYGRVFVSMSGSGMQEIVTDDSVFAWLHRSVMAHDARQ